MLKPASKPGRRGLPGGRGPGRLPPLLAMLSLLAALGTAGCKRRALVFQAERKAQIGGEFIRLYDDGIAEYGYGVVSEKLKAKGPYRYVHDTLFLPDPAFKAHFPEGFLLVKEGVVIMPSGFHFLVTQGRSTP